MARTSGTAPPGTASGGQSIAPLMDNVPTLRRERGNSEGSMVSGNFSIGGPTGGGGLEICEGGALRNIHISIIGLVDFKR